MPANLTPQYLAAEQRFKQAASAQEKIEALEEMLAVIPKHKGTEKMRADLRRRMAKLRSGGDKKHGVSKVSALYSVQREGAGQVVLAGAPNAGKSSLLAKLTHANPEIAEYAFTTRFPRPGMVPYENIQIQLVDMPPISPHFYEPWMGNLVRQADLVLLVVDVGSDALLEDLEGVLRTLEGSRIQLAGEPPAAEPSESPDGAAQLALLVANKDDRENARANLQILREFYASRFKILPVSAKTAAGLQDLPGILFDRLDIIRIFTKAPGKKVDLQSTPFVLKRGSTVIDAARAVHRDFTQMLKFARIWSPERSGGTVKFDGQMVERTHTLEDGDILELHV